MNKYSTLASNLKRKILRFSENISEGFPRPVFKFISQMLYGILASQSCHLSKIARTLNEQISLKKTIERLSRNLSTFCESMALFDKYIIETKSFISKKTILIVDGSDIRKPCSSKLEGLCTVYDGSTGKMATGYHTIGVSALTSEKKQPIGVYSRVYSSCEKEFVSENEETLKALRFLGRHFKKNNIRAFDRGYDAEVFYEHLIDHEEKFVIRAKKNRNVIYKDKSINIFTLAKKAKGIYSLNFQKKDGGIAKCIVSIIPIKLPCRPDDDLNLIVCQGIGKEPLMLITNMQSDDNRIALVVTKVYLLRWRIEEFYGFKKQQFDFENFRIRSLDSIRNLDLILTIAIGFLGMMSDKVTEQNIAMELINISKRIFDIPKFLFYAVADGIFLVFTKCKPGIADLLHPKPKDPQLSFFAVLGFS